MRPIRVPADRASFFLGVANGILWLTGSALFDVSTVVAVFVQRLTESSILVGLIVGLVPLGWQLPQLWQARYLEALADLAHVVGEGSPEGYAAESAAILESLGVVSTPRVPLPA